MYFTIRLPPCCGPNAVLSIISRLEIDPEPPEKPLQNLRMRFRKKNDVRLWPMCNIMLDTVCVGAQRRVSGSEQDAIEWSGRWRLYRIYGIETRRVRGEG
jgi:hypothetical protein